MSNADPRYFFWDTRSEGETTVKSWNRAFRKLFAAADPPIIGGHPHRFRDTFAVSLLLTGVQLPHVAVLLGHAPVKITERQYAPWVKARQEPLEEEVTEAIPAPNGRRATQVPTDAAPLAEPRALTPSPTPLSG